MILERVELVELEVERTVLGIGRVGIIPLLRVSTNE